MATFEAKRNSKDYNEIILTAKLTISELISLTCALQGAHEKGILTDGGNNIFFALKSGLDASGFDIAK